MAGKKVLIAGASGVVGQAALRHFAHDFDWEVVGVSRRPPVGVSDRVHFVSVDLQDQQRCREVFGAMPDVTHVVYAAVNEDPDALIAGWRDRERMQLNLRMLQNFCEPLFAVAKHFQHFSLLQGTKAYGGVAGIDAGFPFRERMPRVVHDNFYFLQEDYIRAQQQGKPWQWTVTRPMLILGDAVGSNLNALLAIGVYAALQREAGKPLSYPGLPERRVTQLIDSDLLAEVLVWAATASGARNEIFNVANGDVCAWTDLWPAVADEFGMKVGEPQRCSLEEELPKQAAQWRAIVRKYQLAAPEDIKAFVGGSTALADSVLGRSLAAGGAARPGGIESTIKLRQAGFHGCIDSEDAVRKWLRRFRELKLLPPVA